VYLNSIPPSEVLLDGQAVGKTPWAGGVSVGAHRVSFVTATGRIDRDLRVDGEHRMCVDLVEDAPCPR
jgi:hypothetical protein